MEKLPGHVLIELGVQLDPGPRLKWYKEYIILKGLSVAFEAVRLLELLRVRVFVARSGLVRTYVGSRDHEVWVVFHLGWRRGIGRWIVSSRWVSVFPLRGSFDW